MPTPTALPAAGTLVYEASGEQLQSWSGTADWKYTGGMIVSSGSNTGDTSVIWAPYSPGSMTDYAVEAEIQFVSGYPECEETSFGLVARGNGDQGYAGGVTVVLGGFCDHQQPIAGIWPLPEVLGTDQGSRAYYTESIGSEDADLDSEWHTYRVEVQANVVRLLVDGDLITEVTDNRFLEAGQVGLWSDRAQLSIRTFKVIAL